MRTDRLTVQLVVFFIGLCGLIIIIGLILLAYTGRDIPEPLSTLGGAAIGALGTLLARTSTDDHSDSACQSVQEQSVQERPLSEQSV